MFNPTANTTTDKSGLANFLTVLFLIIFFITTIAASILAYRFHSDLAAVRVERNQLAMQVQQKDQEIERLKKEVDKATNPNTLDGLKNDSEKISDLLTPYIPNEQQQKDLVENGGAIISDLLTRLGEGVGDVTSQESGEEQ